MCGMKLGMFCEILGACMRTKATVIDINHIKNQQNQADIILNWSCHIVWPSHAVQQERDGLYFYAIEKISIGLINDLASHTPQAVA